MQKNHSVEIYKNVFYVRLEESGKIKEFICPCDDCIEKLLGRKIK